MMASVAQMGFRDQLWGISGKKLVPFTFNQILIPTKWHKGHKRSRQKLGKTAIKTATTLCSLTSEGPQWVRSRSSNNPDGCLCEGLCSRRFKDSCRTAVWQDWPQDALTDWPYWPSVQNEHCYLSFNYNSLLVFNYWLICLRQTIFIGNIPDFQVHGHDKYLKTYRLTYLLLWLRIFSQNISVTQVVAWMTSCFSIFFESLLDNAFGSLYCLLSFVIPVKLVHFVVVPTKNDINAMHCGWAPPLLIDFQLKSFYICLFLT